MVVQDGCRENMSSVRKSRVVARSDLAQHNPHVMRRRYNSLESSGTPLVHEMETTNDRTAVA